MRAWSRAARAIARQAASSRPRGAGQLSRGRCCCEVCADGAEILDFKPAEAARREWGRISRCRAAACAHRSRIQSQIGPTRRRDRPSTRCPWKKRGHLEGGQDDTSCQCATARGAAAPLKRARAIIHHTKPPPARGLPALAPFLALTLSHTSGYRRAGPGREEITGSRPWRADDAQGAAEAWWPRQTHDQ